MHRSRSLKHRFSTMAVTFALAGLVLGAVACDSGTQEPDAPAASNEFGAAPSAATPSDATPSAAAPRVPRDGSIAVERFPSELPVGIVAEVPYNFPSNIPIFPGAQPAQGKGAEVDGSPVSGVQLLSNDTPTTIFNFYDDELKTNGWEITDSKSDPMASSISASNGNCKATIFIQTSPQGGSDIFILNEC